MTERLVTARELGEYLRLSPSTVLDRFERGDLPGYKIGGPVRFRLSEIEAWLEECRRGPALVASGAAGMQSREWIPGNDPGRDEPGDG